jgi:hypothetical protein
MRRRLLQLAIGLLAVYLLIAYLALPLVWRRYVRKHPSIDNVPGITQTVDGIPGDPLNVMLVGDETQIVQAMLAAGWYKADPLGLRSDLGIAADTVLDRPNDRAPVSNLFLFGRKEDVAFERPVANSPRQRHHVRLWRTPEQHEGRDVWIGSSTFDESVGFSHTTGKITHHIAADVDVERDRLIEDLTQTGRLAESYFINDFHQVRQGNNGGGDLWTTDGRLRIGIIMSDL